MKLLVFAHTPPPHHGQSYMVKLLLDGLRADAGFEVFHVNARFSVGTEDIGRMRPGKLWLALRYSLEAIFWRLRRGVSTLYYVPASPGRAALYRDWLIMLMCRPFFARRIFHWHAAGLLEWLERDARPWERKLTDLLLGRPSLSIVLSQFNRRDGEGLRSRRVEVVPNGIPDPCPGFEREVLPARIARVGSRKLFRVLYIGLCFREKGIFDAVEGVRLANERSGGMAFQMTVAGSFWRSDEQAEFEARRRELKLADGRPQVEYVGFVSGEVKEKLFRECDCLVFPTYYATESFGLVVVEAMAFGLPVITTTWRMIPELLPGDYAGFVAPKSPEQIAAKLVDAIRWDFFASLRRHYLRHYTAEEFWRKMKAALQSV